MGDEKNKTAENFVGNSNITTNKLKPTDSISKLTHVQRRQAPTKCLRETDVGITAFLTKDIGFSGILKSRYSDFQVAEIDLDGNVLSLNDLSLPTVPKDALDVNVISKADLGFVTEEKWKEIDDMIESKSKESVKIDVTTIDKDDRKKFHFLVKKKYGNKIISNTENENKDKFIILKYDRKMKGDKRSHWPYNEGEHVHFLLHKENMDTSEVVNILAKKLRVRPSQIGFCGTKDKRAKTTQRFSVKRRLPTEIVAAFKHISRVTVGNFKIEKSPLRLGMLKGNRFHIAIRHLEGERANIDKTLTTISEKGMINYFGLQRFGNNSEVPTYKVGIALLKADYKRVCELILKPRSNDLPQLAPIREFWWKERDAKRAELMFPPGFNCVEREVLHGLAKYDNDAWLIALQRLSRNSLLLYPHAFQSLLFNRVLSHRIREYGFRLLVGDLIYVGETEEVSLISSELMDDDDDNDDDEEDEHPKIKAKKEIERLKKIQKSKNQTIKILTQEDIESGKYTIYNVVLPLPGYNVIYPDNEITVYINNLLKTFGMSIDRFRHVIKTFKVSGTYRKILVKPTDMSWNYVKYDSKETDLILSNVQVLENTELQFAENGENRALILNFNLPSSAYATMLLRELMRKDTSPTAQSQLEQQAIEKAAQKVKDKQNLQAETSRKRQFELTLQTSKDEGAKSATNVANIDGTGVLLHKLMRKDTSPTAQSQLEQHAIEKAAQMVKDKQNLQAETSRKRQFELTSHTSKDEGAKSATNVANIDGTAVQKKQIKKMKIAD